MGFCLTQPRYISIYVLSCFLSFSLTLFGLFMLKRRCVGFGLIGTKRKKYIWAEGIHSQKRFLFIGQLNFLLVYSVGSKSLFIFTFASFWFRDVFCIGLVALYTKREVLDKASTALLFDY